MKNIDLEKILKLNPHIDEETLKQAIELMRKIRESGVKKHGYNLASPYTRRSAPVSPNIVNDPRVVYVGRPVKV